jgi:hypothetical protein
MFESMIERMLMYGAEIWGWKEQECKKIFDVDTQCYTVKEECKRNRLRVKAGKRAAKFEDKMNGRESGGY